MTNQNGQSDKPADRPPFSRQRKLRNYLLDVGMQLRYTGFIMAVAILLTRGMDDEDRGRARSDDDAALEAGDGARHRVTSSDCLSAGALEGDAEGVRPGVGSGELVVGRQDGVGVGRGEVDRAQIAGGDVAVGVFGRDGDDARHPRRAR